MRPRLAGTGAEVLSRRRTGELMFASLAVLSSLGLAAGADREVPAAVWTSIRDGGTVARGGSELRTVSPGMFSDLGGLSFDGDEPAWLLTSEQMRLRDGSASVTFAKSTPVLGYYVAGIFRGIFRGRPAAAQASPPFTPPSPPWPHRRT